MLIVKAGEENNIMLNNCFILFGISGILYFIAKFFEIWTSEAARPGYKPIEGWRRFCEAIYSSVMMMAMVTFFETLILAIYIFVFK